MGGYVFSTKYVVGLENYNGSPAAKKDLLLIIKIDELDEFHQKSFWIEYRSEENLRFNYTGLCV